MISGPTHSRSRPRQGRHSDTSTLLKPMLGVAVTMSTWIFASAAPAVLHQRQQGANQIPLSFVDFKDDPTSFACKSSPLAQVPSAWYLQREQPVAIIWDWVGEPPLPGVVTLDLATETGEHFNVTKEPLPFQTKRISYTVPPVSNLSHSGPLHLWSPSMPNSMTAVQNVYLTNDLRACESVLSKTTVPIYVGPVVGGVCVIFLGLAFGLYRRNAKRKERFMAKGKATDAQLAEMRERSTKVRAEAFLDKVARKSSRKSRRNSNSSGSSSGSTQDGGQSATSTLGVQSAGGGSDTALLAGRTSSGDEEVLAIKRSPSDVSSAGTVIVGDSQPPPLAMVSADFPQRSTTPPPPVPALPAALISHPSSSSVLSTASHSLPNPSSAPAHAGATNSDASEENRPPVVRSYTGPPPRFTGGSSTWRPKTQVGTLCKAIFPHKPDLPDEMNLHRGDYVVVEAFYEDDWVLVRAQDPLRFKFKKRKLTGGEKDTKSKSKHKEKDGKNPESSADTHQQQPDTPHFNHPSIAASAGLAAAHPSDSDEINGTTSQTTTSSTSKWRMRRQNTSPFNSASAFSASFPTSTSPFSSKIFSTRTDASKKSMFGFKDSGDSKVGWVPGDQNLGGVVPWHCLAEVTEADMRELAYVMAEANTAAAVMTATASNMALFK